ncbi:unnamed protein product [Rhizoctonia solani]|uniref:Polyketide synthase-like phosphopantetheine-binding domain-containing protein n=1 Tax=Rhizoctonia solani TaxID=456999 RepID=A0A8H3HXT7_9AGAM|nr:unnamed protein product [Rhizoctonia solani]
MAVLPHSYVTPPTDGSIPPASVIDFHLKNNPNHAFAVLYDASNSSRTTITYQQLACAVHRVAYTLNPENKIPQGSTIGILISASTLEYVVLVLGAMRAGLVPFPISPRVQLAGIAHLLATTQTSLVVAGGSDAIDNATAQLSELLDESSFGVEFIQFSALRDSLSPTKTSAVSFRAFPSLGPMKGDSTVTILHSSGSTGMPKAIKYHLEGVFNNTINQPIEWTFSEPNTIVGTLTLPTFHCMGMILQVLAPIYVGYTQLLFAPARIPALPTPASTLEAIVNVECAYLICVPIFLEAWAHDKGAIAVLKRMKAVIFGGGPLTDEIGDKLVSDGLRIHSGYGATEFGTISVLPPRDQPDAWPWNYLRFSHHGLILQVLAPLYMGYTQALFAPARIPVMPNPSLTLDAIANTNCNFLICVPTFLDAWVNDKNATIILKRMKGIMYGGGPLSDAVGTKLTDHGVRIYPLYGATEVGIINVAPPPDQTKLWDCIELSPHLKTHFIPQNDQDNTVELVFEGGKDHRPFVLNSELNGKAVYRTRDLLTSHPFKPNSWKFVGRVDDRIVLLNGEKTNPAPMEAEIAKCALVHSTIIFGQARNQTGILIELTEPLGSPPGHRMKYSRRELTEILRPYIQRANQTSATHSRLDERAVVFVDPDRPLPRTPKGTIPRSAALKLYAPDIEEMYTNLEREVDADSSSLVEVQSLETWSRLEVVSDWISGRIKRIIGRDISMTADMFQQGMDSLTAMMLLRDLRITLHASQDSNLQMCARTLNQTVIFDNPTVQQLASFLVQRIAHPSVTGNQTLTTLETIHTMIQKYDSGWSDATDSRCSRRPVALKERVVVTGTTGGLGSHILAQLLVNDKVERVWVLNRNSNGDIRDRQRMSFEDKLLDVELLTSKKIVFVDVVLEQAKLGLSSGLYDEIRSTATVIIHVELTAGVNFNLALKSFEPHIQSTRNLLDLAFGSTASTGLPRFIFTSSVSVAGTSGLGGRLDEVSVPPEDAVSTTGYGQSKLVAEKLLESARRAGLQTCIVRLGQLTVYRGILGICRMFACSSWDIAARSIIDICATCDEELLPVIHASHPRPVPWVDIMTAFSEVLAPRIGCSLPTVELEEWNKRVAQKAANFQGSDVDRYQHYPSTKIQGVVDGMAHADRLLRSRDEEDVESAGTVRLVTKNTERISKGLRSTPGLGKAHVEKWVKYWEAKGLFVGPV